MPSKPEDLDFFSTKSGPYYIYAYNYRDTSAGNRALYILCHMLNCLGQEAYITNSQVVPPQLRTPLLDSNTLAKHYLTGRVPIAVYPEVVSGNPIRLPVVARWLLHKPGHFTGATDYDAKDLFFHFMDWVVPADMQGCTAQLTVPVTDPAIFNNEDNPHNHKRQGICYYANKLQILGGEVDPEMKLRGTSLGLERPLKREELAAVLRQTEALYCYEHTALIEEALRCGCPVILVSSAYCDWKKEGGKLLNTPGVALVEEPDHLERAKATVAKYIRPTNQLNYFYVGMIEEFIRLTQARRDEVTGQRAPSPRKVIENAWSTPQRRNADSDGAFMKFYGISPENFRQVAEHLY